MISNCGITNNRKKLHSTDFASCNLDRHQNSKHLPRLGAFVAKSEEILLSTTPIPSVEYLHIVAYFNLTGIQCKGHVPQLFAFEATVVSCCYSAKVRAIENDERRTVCDCQIGFMSKRHSL